MLRLPLAVTRPLLLASLALFASPVLAQTCTILAAGL